MTKATATVEAAPPQDYGNGETWADSGDYAVPPELRPYYATAEPSPVERAGYIQHGASISETRTRDIQRVLSPGTFDQPPVVVTETEPVDCLVDIGGATGYRTWLHLMRMRIAQRAKQSADLQRARGARYGTCPVCGVRAATVRADAAFYAGTRVRVTGCPHHLPVLLEAARTELVARAADQTLPDGRRVGDIAAELVTAQLEKDSAP